MSKLNSYELKAKADALDIWLKRLLLVTGFYILYMLWFPSKEYIQFQLCVALMLAGLNFAVVNMVNYFSSKSKLQFGSNKEEYF